MNCLTNYIGLKGCGTTPPESGIYINQLAGMSNDLLEGLADSDQGNYIEFFNDVQATVFEDIKSQLRSLVRGWGQTQMEQTLFYTNRINIQDRQVISPVGPEAKYKGIFASAYGSRYFEFRLKNLWVYNSGNAVQDVPFKVFNTFDWSVVFETTVDLVEGINNISIEQSMPLQFMGYNLFFALDTTDVSTINNSYLQDDYFWADSDCACANLGPNHYGFNMKQWELYPASMPLDVALPDKIQFDFSQSGVMVDLELNCSIEAFICQNRNALKMGIAYALAAEILLRKLMSFNQNFHARYNQEAFERILATIQATRDKHFQEWAKVIQVRGEDMCFSCEEADMISNIGVRS